MRRCEIVQIFPGHIRSLLEMSGIDYEQLYEIRMRICNPLLVIYGGREYFLSKKGIMTQNKEIAYQVTQEDIHWVMEAVSQYSMYAYEDEIRQGFLTIQGGHRIGIAGKAIIEKEHVKGMKYISYINIRLSHQVKGCARPVLPYVIDNQGVHHTLIISPPRCGKTTLLRDLIRQISDGNERFAGATVGVVDERSEIGGSYMGVPQNDLGIRTDILDCCPKAEGMMMLIRSMSPEVVAVDELGNYEDIHAIEAVIHCGCKLLATVHGSSIADIERKPLLQRLVKERIFERYILLKKHGNAGQIQSIFDERGTCLFDKSESVC